MSRRLLTAYGLLLFLLVVLRTAWLSDHAYMALRTADNAAWGLGFRWNAVERVQVFDHPLWMLCLYLARMTTGEVYYGTIVLSIVCAVLAAGFVLRQAATDIGVLVAALALALSPTLVTYSTSGLGTPLVHLLIAAFAALVLRDHLRGFRVSIVAALAALTDPATLLLTLPVGLFSLRRLSPFGRRRRGLSPLLRDAGGHSPSQTQGEQSSLQGHGGQPPCSTRTRGQSPHVAPFAAISAAAIWAAIATFYYGSVLPAGTIAQLHQGITIGQRLQAGASFAADAARRDPILAVGIVAGLLLPFVRLAGSRSTITVHGGSDVRESGAADDASLERALAGSALLYTAAILFAGGSAWSGYGLTPPFLIAVLIVARQPILAKRHVGGAALAAVVMLAAITPVHTFHSHAQYGFGTPVQSGIIDPRQQDYQATGLLLVRRNQWFPDHPESVRGLRAGERRDAIGSSPRPGFFGYAAGRTVYVLDSRGLGDPLLSRLPPGAPLLPGGSPLELRTRNLPEGYIESLLSNDNRLADPTLAALYDRVRFVTRAPLTQDGRTENAVRLSLDP